MKCGICHTLHCVLKCKEGTVRDTTQKQGRTAHAGDTKHVVQIDHTFLRVLVVEPLTSSQPWVV